MVKVLRCIKGRCVLLEHSPALPTPTTSIGAFPTPTPLSTYPPTSNSYHTATYPPRYSPNPRHHTTTPTHLPQTPTLSPTPAHTTHALPTQPQAHTTCQPYHLPTTHATTSKHPTHTPTVPTTTATQPTHTPQTIVYTTISSD